MKNMLCIFLLVFIIQSIYSGEFSKDYFQEDYPWQINPSLYLLVDTLSEKEVQCILRGKLDEETIKQSIRLSIFPGFGLGHKKQKRDTPGRVWILTGETIGLGIGILGCFLSYCFKVISVTEEWQGFWNTLFWTYLGVGSGIFSLFKVIEIIDVSVFPIRHNRMYIDLME